MKIIKYNFLSCRINKGTVESPIWEDIILSKEIICNEANLITNEAIAKAEAYNGEYTIEDDGREPVVEESLEERTTALEEALGLLLEGATE